MRIFLDELFLIIFFFFPHINNLTLSRKDNSKTKLLPTFKVLPNYCDLKKNVSCASWKIFFIDLSGSCK